MKNKIIGTNLVGKSIVDIENIVFFILMVILYIFNFRTETNGNVLTNILIAAFAGIELIKTIQIGRIKVDKYVVTLFLFSLVSYFSIVYSVSYSNTLMRSKTLLMNIIFLIALMQFFSNKEKLIFGLYCIEFGGVAASVFSFFNSSFLDGERTTDVIGNANTIAIYLSFVAIISLYFALKKDKIIIHSISYFILIFAIFITGSRSGTIILAFGTTVILLNFMGSRISAFKKICVVVFAIVAIMGLWYFITHNSFMYEILGERFKSLYEIITTKESSTGEGSTFERFEMAKLAFKVFCENPILGCGLGGIGYYIGKEITGFYTFCHNNYFEILSGLGILGFALYYSVHFRLIISYVTLKNKYKSISNIYFLGFVLLICILFSHFFIVHYYYKFEFLYLAVVIKIVEMCKSEFKMINRMTNIKCQYGGKK